MTQAELVLGLLDTSRTIGDAVTAQKHREYTVSWSRYGYQGVILERDTVDAILAAADEAGFAYCFIQPYGCILSEHWHLDDQQPRDFFSVLKTWIDADDFLVAGSIIGDAGAWYGFAAGCLLVDLENYRRLARPAFDVVSDGPRRLPSAAPRLGQGRIHSLLPTAEADVQYPRLWGWNFIATSLQHGLPVLAFNDDLRARTLNLEATCVSRRNALMRYAGEGILRYPGAGKDDNLSPDQSTFLDVVSAQTAHARQGVFLWNIESYADIETPRDDFASPVSTLYSVAAGFKPNRILETHGFGENTKVVFFDYSPAALAVKKCLVEQWDGEDFPRFAKYLFQKFPYPETFYQLWHNVTPDDVNWDDIEFVWQRELNRWGGPEALRGHWRAYRELEHEYVCCNIMTDPSPLLKEISGEPSAIIWWSNAFFTMYGNWFFTIEQRKEAYDHWIGQLANQNPHLYLFGSDFNNTSVNFVQAAEYWDQYCRSGVDCLEPFKLQRTEIRM